MRIGICDDDQSMRKILGEKVMKYVPEAEVIYFSSGYALLKEEEKPAILFLDIQMPGIDGMETAKKLRRDNDGMIIIFVTALQEYVYDAFDVSAFHYLIKPFSDEKFREVLQRAVVSGKREEPEKKAPYLLIQHAGIHEKIYASEIVYAEAEGRKILLHKRDGDVAYYGRFADLEKSLGDHFFRCHRSYLVNFSYVTRYEADCVHTQRGTALMSKANYPKFVKRFLEYNSLMGLWDEGGAERE